MAEYKYEGLLGCVERRKIFDLNSVTSVWCGVQSGMQTNVRMGRWIAVCETHAKFRLLHTLKEAKELSNDPKIFCEKCEMRYA